MLWSLPTLLEPLASAGSAVTFRTQDVSEDDCELYEGCRGGTGRRTLMELSFTIRNAGGGTSYPTH